MKKIYIVLFFLLISCKSKADVYFTIPEEMELQEMNKGIKKTINRYKSEKQIENQYKGKLKYKPSDSMYKNDRKGRYFTSVFFMLNNNSFSTATDVNNDYVGNFGKNNNFDNSIAAEIGRYFSNSVYISFEYFEYAGGKSSFEYMNSSYSYDLSIDHNGQAYLFNIGFENNYSRIIPFFGVGIGAFRSTFEEVNTSTISGLFTTYEIKDNIIPVYQFFAGFDFLLNDDMFLTFKYKYFNFTKDIRLKRIYGSTTNRYDLELEKNNSSFMFGFKYIW